MSSCLCAPVFNLCTLTGVFTLIGLLLVAYMCALMCVLDLVRRLAYSPLFLLLDTV